MKPPPIPKNEISRIETLNDYDILDTPPEKAYDDLTWLAAQIAGTPIALISLIDQNRQWFKSKQGMDACETPRNISFCGHAILQDKPLVVSNALEDERFADNPLVTGGLNIRFYLGFPLTTPGGHNLGTLCVIDRVTRALTENQVKMLSALARQVVSLFELRLAGTVLRKSVAEAERANQAKSLFLANMSHEIRTPMNAVIGMTDLLLGTKLSQQQKKYLHIVSDSAESLLRLLNDILDFSKIESGKLDFESIPFGLENRIKKIINTYAIQARNKGIALVLDLEPKIPSGLIGDPVRLEQILVNLIGNAVKFTEKGEVRVSVKSLDKKRDRIQIGFEVKDTGIGIPHEKQKTIFEVFSQADGSTTRIYGGTGLGLAIASRLINLLGGQLRLESEQEKGSKFRFSAWYEIASGYKTEPRPRGRPDLAGKRILIVDDIDTDRFILKTALTRWGMKVTEAVSGENAIELLEEGTLKGESFDCVLIDLHMPKIDGFETARRLNEIPGLVDTVVLLLVSVDRSISIQQCRENGIHDLLRKPIRKESLRKLLERYLVEKGSTEPTPPEASIAQTAKNILVVEDNRVNQMLTLHMLERMNHRVDIAADGKAAVEAVRAKQYDLILMDIQMPEWDGFETTTAIREFERERGYRIPIIALTAHAMKGDRERCLETEMDGYLSKPIKWTQFQEVINDVLSKVSQD